MTHPTMETKYLIIGAGPAGLALATFLGRLGLEGIVISKAASTAYAPRAHCFNPFGFECFRDIGIEGAALDMAFTGDATYSMRWCRDMRGTNYGHVRGWCEHPPTKSILTDLSPCGFAEFTQSQMEPLLLKTASQHGFTVRYSTELIDLEEVTTGQHHKSLYECSVRDLVYGQTYSIRAPYVFGADGARSHVGRALSFPYTGKPGGGKACNILFRADLSHIMIPERHAGLHWILKPDQENGFGIVAHLRMVQPWNEWILVDFRGDQKDPFENMTTKSPELIEIIRELIGDKSVDIEVLRLDPWTVRESVADRYDQHGSNVYLLGDAAHRHPPAFGLGSNTCVQDAYNLAWKVAYVDRGLAGPGLLASYSRERKPVGSTLVKAANEGLRAHAVVWECLGMFSESRSEGASHLKRITASDEAGKAARQRLSSALDQIGHEIQSLGICYNQWYDDSDAVYTHDERGPHSCVPEDPVADPLVTTYPGSRLPHAWLDVPDRGKRISTHDLAGKGAFCVLFGEGGASWGDAANNITQNTGIPINAYGIGYGLEYIDIDRTWSARREVSEGGCILVRPDRFVAWRAQEMETDCEQKLMLVLNSVLCRV